MQRISPLNLSLLLFAGCGLKLGDLGELTEASGDAASETAASATPGTGDEPTTGDGETAGPDSEGDGTETDGQLAPAKGVDILFIIDNSGSMAEEQERMVSAIPKLIDPLVAAGLDLRIGVTTTDSGNPRCPSAQYTPEGGNLVSRSCRAQVAEGEWQFNAEDFSAACLAACARDDVPILPTTTAVDPEARPRKWLEWNKDGVSNTEVPFAEALACLLPQGVAGCGFESPLESMYLALAGAQSDKSKNNFGFLRDDAHLLVVIVTDEMDCSWNPAWKDIFTTNKVFWNDPQQDAAPTSGMCWRAGMACAGGPGTYDGCVATDHDAGGAVTQDPEAAVLMPLSRYQGVLSTILAGKQAAGSSAKVRLMAVAGVPVGYPQVPLVYADGDEETQASFGIAAGCTAMGASAVPPGRILDLAQQVNQVGPNVFSICDDSFDGSLAAIAAELLE